MAGDAIVPLARMTRLAEKSLTAPLTRQATPTARFPPQSILSATAPVTTVRLGRAMAGSRKATAAL